MRKCGVYKITNPIGQIYIGSSCNIDRRFYQHKHCGIFGTNKLSESYRKFGVINHEFEILELCNKEELREKEKYYGEILNCMDNDKGLNTALPYTKQKKEHINKRKCCGEKNGMYGKTSPMKGKHLSKETRKYLSKIRKGERTYGNNSNAKKVIDLKENKIYNSAKELAEKLNINYSTFKAICQGRSKIERYRYVK